MSLGIGGLGMAVSMLGNVLGMGKKDKTEGVGGEGFDIQALLGKGGDVTEDGVNTSDSVSAGTQDALGMLKDMTEGGMEGYFKWMVKQLREKTMESMGVTEADLQKMDPAQKDAITQKIEEAVKKEVAKIMGVDPEAAQKMIAASDSGASVTAGTELQARKAYREDVPTV